MIEPERDLLAHLRALDEQLARVEPSPYVEARIRARLASRERPSVSLVALVGGAWKLRRPLLLACASASALFLSLPTGVPEAQSRLGGAPRIAAPAGSVAAEETIGTPAPILPERPRLPLGPPDVSDPERPSAPRLPAPDPSVRPAPAPLPPAPSGLLEDAPPPRSLERPRPSRHDLSSGGEVLEWTQAVPGGPRVPFVAPEPAGPPHVEPKTSSPGASSSPRPAPAPAPAACATAEALKEEAYLDCEGKDLVLAEITYREPCNEGGFRGADHHCAEPEPEPEPEPDADTCTTGTLGDGVTCEDPSLLKNKAAASCGETGRALVDFTYTSDGCGWQTREAQFTCCPAAPPDPEPVPDPEAPVCKEGALGDGMVCRDMSLFKQEAYQVCTSAGLILVDLFYGGDCSDGQATKAGFSCCTSFPVGP